MKKLTVIFLLVALATVGVFAVTPEYFTVNIGTQTTYRPSNGNVGVVNPFGLQFQFDETFSAGFSYNGANQGLLNITATPVENVKVSMYTGNVNAGGMGFGLGLGYDFLVKKAALFTSMGLYIDWLANNTASGTAYSINDGGVIAIGLKAGFGL
ncbi:MAG: hypothetical protein JXA95_18545 [Spirochaetales bacterium]|nr:hypothetical protein [Spirochaetales bacterium]